MVETLVFETPTPLPEHAEREFSFAAEQHAAAANTNTRTNAAPATNGFNNSLCLDDSGIEMQEE